MVKHSCALRASRKVKITCVLHGEACASRKVKITSVLPKIVKSTTVLSGFWIFSSYFWFYNFRLFLYFLNKIAELINM